MALFAQPAPRASNAVEVLDLRHFSAAELAPLLREEAARWNERHRWDYTRAIDLLLEYLDSRVLPGFVALDRHRRILGYAFCVHEADKAVIGDLYAFERAAPDPNSICRVLLTHLLEMLEASPWMRRIESQLLMFAAGALTEIFLAHGFRSHPRLFMLAELDPKINPALNMPQSSQLQPALRFDPWQPESTAESAALIHLCYQHHGDSLINDQYQTVAGAERFLHNIIRFPGCGVFDAESSLLARDPRTGSLQALLLCSRVRSDASHITQLCVRPELRGHGIGHQMLLHCATELRRRGIASISLTVTEANTAAHSLYTSLGFKTLHRFEAMTWDRRS